MKSNDPLLRIPLAKHCARLSPHALTHLILSCTFWNRCCNSHFTDTEEAARRKWKLLRVNKELSQDSMSKTLGPCWHPSNIELTSKSIASLFSHESEKSWTNSKTNASSSTPDISQSTCINLEETINYEKKMHFWIGEMEWALFIPMHRGSTLGSERSMFLKITKMAKEGLKLGL